MNLTTRQVEPQRIPVSVSQDVKFCRNPPRERSKA